MGTHICWWRPWSTALYTPGRNPVPQWQKIPRYIGRKIKNMDGNSWLKSFPAWWAPCHRAKAVTKWLQENEVTVLAPWPGNSPDLNIIENGWTIVKKEVAATNPSSMTDLIAVMKAAWMKITPGYCRKLSDSMPRWIQLVLAAKGGHSKYW